MTDHTEMQIPSDILAAAWACVDHYTDPDLVPVIAMALVRERERCARIAGNFLMLNSGLDVVKVVQCEEAIRSSVDK